MTYKRLIVDNIDVSKCEFLIITNDKHLCRCIKSDLFGGIEFVENAKNGNCKDNPNCYYKQLQREKQSSQESRDTSIKEFNRAEELNTLLKHKVQECDRLKHDNDYQVGALEKTIDNLTAENEELERLYKELLDDMLACNKCRATIKLQKQLDQLETENEKLKEQINCRCFDPKNNNNRCISYNRIAEDYERDLKQLNQLKEDNEELKKQLQAQHAFTRHEQKLIYCVAYDETCKTGNDCKQEKCIFKDNIKLKQTLTEIKEYLIKECKICKEQCAITNEDCADCQAQEILQKISEVEDA